MWKFFCLPCLGLGMLDLDFQPRRPGILAITLLAVAGLLLADVVWEYQQRSDAVDAVQDELSRLERRLQRRQQAERQVQPANVFSKEEAAALQQAVAAISIDWEGLFSAIDAAISDDIALTAIRPSVSTKSVQISGEGREMASILVFVEALRRAPLSQVVLVSHQLKQSDAQRPYSFEITAVWRVTF